MDFFSNVIKIHLATCKACPDPCTSRAAYNDILEPIRRHSVRIQMQTTSELRTLRTKTGHKLESQRRRETSEGYCLDAVLYNCIVYIVYARD